MLEKARYAWRVPTELWQMLVTYYPGPVGHRLRRLFWKKRLNYLGEDVVIDVGVYFQNPSFISIDDWCWIDRGVMILAGADVSNRKRRTVENPDFPLERGSVHIGRNIHIGPNSILSGIGGVYVSDDCTLSAGVKVFSFSHHYRSDEQPDDRDVCFGSMVEPERQFLIEGPVFLGENVGVALDATILPGVSIARDSFVCIGSVVSSSFGENSLVAGNPASRVKDRFETAGGEGSAS